MKENIVAFLITEIYVSYCLHFNSPPQPGGLFYDPLTTEVKIFADCVK